MTSADVATAKAKATLIIIVSLQSQISLKARRLALCLGLATPPPLERPIVLNAKAVIPCHTLVLGWGDNAGIKLADTIDYYLVGVLALAGFADLRDHAVWLMKRRG
jgi:hypothetical protein